MVTDAGMEPQKNVPQAEHMPHVMPRARSSKSSGRVRQIKQRSAEHFCGCWCNGVVWLDGWAAFGAFPTAGARFFVAFVAAGEAAEASRGERGCEIGRQLRSHAITGVRNRSSMHALCTGPQAGSGYEKSRGYVLVTESDVCS